MQQSRHLPTACQPGDRVMIVAPSGPFLKEDLFAGCDILRSWNLEPVFDPSILQKWGYLAGEDQERANSLLHAFRDPSIKAIICARGGYGAARLFPFLKKEIEEIRKNPKRFFGFSDVSALHLFLAQETNWITFHSPMVASRLFLEGSEESQDRFKKALFAESDEELFPALQCRVLQSGASARGRLIATNLTLLTNFLGTPWQIDPDGAILAIEDVGEQPYRIDRLIQQLHLSGYLERLAGIVLGDFGSLKDRYQSYDPDSFWLERLRLPSNIPILIDAPIGHIRENATLPFGLELEVDTKKEVLQIFV